MKHRLYKWVAMLFSLSNALDAFMHLMNHVLHEFIGRFVMVYFEDISIYSKDHKKHTKNLKKFLKCYNNKYFLAI